MTASPARREWLPYAIAAGLLIAIKLYASLVMSPIGDEAYYWLWGQHPALSYFDHPPLHAWLLGLVDLVLGWSLPSLRLLTWVTFAGTLGIFWYWSKRLSPDDPASWFWRAATIYLASPLFLGMSSIAFNDHLMMALGLASAHFMLRFAERWEAGEARWPDLYLAALLLGLAVLAKYNAVFIGLGYAAFFALRPPLRPLFLRLQTYLAGALAVALQLPVFYWNYVEGFASYRFHFAERWGDTLELSWQSPLVFLLVACIAVSPFALIGTVRYFLQSPDSDFAARAKQLAICVFAISSVSMLALASFATVYLYWNIVAFLLLLPLLVNAMGRAWLFWLHFLYGLVLALLLVFNQTVAPVGNVLGGYDWTFSSTYGWDDIAAAVEEERAAHPEAFVAATRYTTAAQLGWATRDAEVTAISPRPDQFDFWFDAEAHRGQDAIIVTDTHYPISVAAPHFESVTLLRQLQVESRGQVVYSPSIYLATDFTPAATD